jgi:hypothetical protein
MSVPTQACAFSQQPAPHAAGADVGQPQVCPHTSSAPQHVLPPQLCGLDAGHSVGTAERIGYFTPPRVGWPLPAGGKLQVPLLLHEYPEGHQPAVASPHALASAGMVPVPRLQSGAEAHASPSGQQ